MDENNLIQSLLAGEPNAYHSLVLRYHSLLIRIATTYVSPARAEEVVQEAWLAAVKALPKFERRSSLKTWLIRIVINCAKNRIRYQSHRIADNDTISLDITENDDTYDSFGHRKVPVQIWEFDTPEAMCEQQQLLVYLQLSIEQLPTQQQQVIIMHDIEGVNMDEICNILEISESNSRVLLHRARTKLLLCIEAYQRGDNVKL